MNTPLEFETTLARREAIRERIDTITKQLGRAPNLSLLASQASQEMARIRNSLERHGREDHMSNQQQQDLALYRQRHATADRIYQEAKAFQEPLRAELAELQAELAGFDCSCSLRELLGIQEELATVEGETERIRQAIADQEGKKVSAWEAVPTIDELIEKRQELLAQQEIGQEIKAELATVEQELEQGKQAVQEARTKAEATEEQAEEVIAGLKRMLEAKEKRAKELRQVVQPNAVNAFLLVRLDTIGAEYAKAASTLMEKYSQLAALGNILVKRNEQDLEAIPWRTALHLRLPVFPTASCRKLSGEPVKWYNPEAIAAEQQALQRLGVQM